MKKGLGFTRGELEDLYLSKGLSLNQIARRFDCNCTNILYWLKKFDIKRRPAYRKKIDIPKNILIDLYWNKNLTTSEIAKEFGIRYGRTVNKKLKRLGIPTKTISQAMTKKFKRPFQNNLYEKAYFLGLRAGDFYGKWARKSIRIQTTTTHLAQVELLKKSFEKYGEIRTYLSKNNSREDEWFIYVDLDPSFDFLLTKPEKIPTWILDKDEYFYNFLSAYSDCESNWNLTKSHGKHLRFTFRLRTGDKIILEQIKMNFEGKGLYPLLDLIVTKGIKSKFGNFNKEIYNLTLNKREDILYLISKLLPLSKHSEKIRKMEFILKNKDKNWEEIELNWNDLRGKIKKELLKNQIEINL